MVVALAGGAHSSAMRGTVAGSADHTIVRGCAAAPPSVPCFPSPASSVLDTSTSSISTSSCIAPCAACPSSPAGEIAASAPASSTACCSRCWRAASAAAWRSRSRTAWRSRSLRASCSRSCSRAAFSAFSCRSFSSLALCSSCACVAADCASARVMSVGLVLMRSKPPPAPREATVVSCSSATVHSSRCMNCTRGCAKLSSGRDRFRPSASSFRRRSSQTLVPPSTSHATLSLPFIWSAMRALPEPPAPWAASSVQPARTPACCVVFERSSVRPFIVRQ
mmetsp:Transcript_1302/g.4672  ORF Transcript_1302/g.4672 Transcript_1302/m.4672 type:complete len:279 (-) Transcript_1302:139-975(-)